MVFAAEEVGPPINDFLIGLLDGFDGFRTRLGERVWEKAVSRPTIDWKDWRTACSKTSPLSERMSCNNMGNPDIAVMEVEDW